ncbi:MAG TPA: class I SAM-dependent methyltransferase [Chitinophagaceae bacterium]|nr:class I SAM-dependent methyltransferase [Chitinophagaceae bacterium]
MKLWDKLLGKPVATQSEKAYDLWANSYDNQPDNLMMHLDNEVFTSALSAVKGTNEIIVDVGCGTGRHWPELIARKPSKVVGFDSSPGMLDILRKKFPKAEAHLIEGTKLDMPDESVDLLVSTLTIAHIQNIEEALTEWGRVLKPGGHMIITDYHPAALAKGGLRTFKSEGKVISIKNYVHPLDFLISTSASLRLNLVQRIERVIDETVKPFYAKQNALHIYDQFRGTEIIFGLHFKKL